MSWAPNDLVSDTDLEGYERDILTQFAAESWLARRQKALEDWLFPLLEANRFDPQRLRTRYVPTAVLGHTSGAYTEQTAAADAWDGLDLSAILLTATDSLYIASVSPFRGVSVRMQDNVNTADAGLSVALWSDGWTAPSEIDDGTRKLNASFGRGGPVIWAMPDTLVRRVLNGSAEWYWARLRLTAAPSAGTKAGPISVIRRSRLCAPATLRTLALIYREAPTSQDGPWREKAEWYEAEAERAWLRVADQIGGEFDSDNDDRVSPIEAGQTAASVTDGGWRMERC